jgi:YidC/Oxa1 family membrane protein insertase
MQTQRTILWVIFTMSLLFLWDGWQRHQGNPSLFGGSAPTQTAPAADGKAAPGAPAKTDNSIPPVGSAAVPTVAAATGAGSVPGAAAGATPAAGSAALRFKTDVIALDIDPIGGEIQRTELLRYRDTDNADANVMLFDERTGHVYLAQSGLVGPAGAQFPTHRTPFTIEPGPRELTPGNDELVITMHAESGGAKVVRRYTLRRGSYRIDMSTEVTNTGATPIQPTLYLQLTRDTTKPPGESQFYSTYTGPVVYTDKEKFQKVDFSDIEKGKATHSKSASDGWVGIIQHYFATAWVPTEGAPREFFTRKVDTNLYSVGMLEPMKEIAPGTTVTVKSTLYAGPQDQKVLAEIAPGLELTVDYGWLTVIAKPLFWLLQYLHGVVQNWGWAIVLLTIVIKFAFFPLQAASYRSMAKMKKVTPKLTQLRERYGSDRVKLNQAMMELYKTEKINPLGGCLPILVQIPVFISLYWVLLASVEMRNAPWILWIEDLAIPDPFFILPVLMAVTMFIQTKLNPVPPDPLQAKMMLWMPLIFSVMFFFFPAGLVLYWLVNNLFSIAQQWVITRKIEGKPVFGRAPA